MPACLCADVNCAIYGCKQTRKVDSADWWPNYKYWHEYPKGTPTKEFKPVDEEQVRKIIREELERIFTKA